MLRSLQPVRRLATPVLKKRFNYRLFFAPPVSLPSSFFHLTYPFSTFNNSNTNPIGSSDPIESSRPDETIEKANDLLKTALKPATKLKIPNLQEAVRLYSSIKGRTSDENVHALKHLAMVKEDEGVYQVLADISLERNDYHTYFFAKEQAAGLIKDNTEAIKKLRECLAERKAKLGEKDPTNASCIFMLATFTEPRDKNEANRLAKEAVELVKNSNVPETSLVEVYETFLTFRSLYHVLSDEDGILYGEKALKYLDPEQDALRILKIQQNLGYCYARKKDEANMVRCFEAYSDKVEGLEDYDWEDSQLCNSIFRYYMSQRNNAGIAKFGRRLSQRFVQLINSTGDLNFGAMAIYSCTGASKVLEENGDLKEAGMLILEALGIAGKYFMEGGDDVTNDLVNTMNSFAERHPKVVEACVAERNKNLRK